MLTHEEQEKLNYTFLDFLKSQNIFFNLSKNFNANWTDGQNIENCDTLPLHMLTCISGLLTSAFLVSLAAMAE